MLESELRHSVPIKKISVEEDLPHHCKCGEMLTSGNDFKEHCKTKHEGYAPKGSIINASPFRYFIICIDEEDFVELLSYGKFLDYG